MKSIKRVLTVCGMSGLFMLVMLAALPKESPVSAQTPHLPEIAISPGYSVGVDPGSAVDYVHIITNTGNVDVQLEFQLTASEGWPVTLFNAAYPEGTTVGLPLPLSAGEMMTMGIRLTVPVTASSGVVNTTTFTVTPLFQGDRYTQVFADDIAVVREQESPYSYIYLPLVLRNYILLVNGDFSDGLAGWSASGVLGVAIALDPSNTSNPVSRLGNPGYVCWGVPVGNAVIHQQFSVPSASDGNSVHLHFRYRIFTNDLNRSLTDAYDTFDVFVNDVLRLRDANTNEDYFDKCNVPPYDLGWRTADIDLGAGGIAVDLSLEVHNRFDNWYNTYVYIDDIRLVEGD
ncbi:MAG: hypothetical protein JXR84_12155 [Anaerolineae bacterium]|nr:hypothetical protein [Anaerolineae bacterium]